MIQRHVPFRFQGISIVAAALMLAATATVTCNTVTCNTVTCYAVTCYAGDDGRPIVDGDSEFLEPLERIVNQRNESAADRIQAVNYFAQARIHFNRREIPEALAKYQRAYHYDSAAPDVLRQIVVLAFSSKRFDEAARYAALADKPFRLDPLLLARLATYLSQKRDWEQAVNVYRQLLADNNSDEVSVSNIQIHMELGRLLFLLEKYPQAAKHFAVVQQGVLDPQRFGIGKSLLRNVLQREDRTYTLFGEAFFSAERYEDALRMFALANKAKEDKAKYSLQRARVLSKQEKYRQAADALNQYFAEGNPLGSDEPFELVRLLLDKEEGNGEGRYLERLHEIRSLGEKWSYVDYLIGRQLTVDKKFKEAAEAYDRALGKAFDLTRVSEVMRFYLTAKTPEPTLPLLLAAVEDGASFQELSSFVDVLADDKAFAKSVIAVADNDDGNELPSQIKLPLALLALELGEDDFAMQCFEDAYAVAEAGRADLLLNFGLELLTRDQNEESAKLFRRAIEEKVLPKSDYAFNYYLAGALASAKNFDEALLAAEKAADLNPTSVTMQSRVPWVLYYAKRYEESEKAYTRLVKKHDSDFASPEIRDMLRSARLVLSNICVLQDRTIEGEQWLEQVLDEFPEDISAMNDLAYLWADQGKHLERSLRMMKKVIDSQPDSSAYRDSLGWAYFKLGQTENAVRELEIAAAGDEPDGVILDHLGDAYHANKQLEKAIATWQRACQAFENSGDSAKLRQTEKKLSKATAE